MSAASHERSERENALRPKGRTGPQARSHAPVQRVGNTTNAFQLTTLRSTTALPPHHILMPSGENVHRVSGVDCGTSRACALVCIIAPGGLEGHYYERAVVGRKQGPEIRARTLQPQLSCLKRQQCSFWSRSGVPDAGHCSTIPPPTPSRLSLGLAAVDPPTNPPLGGGGGAYTCAPAGPRSL